ncbi:MAG: hypothetical protein H6699_00105 [Myxococcales bacterium]|nr:hypothetical protein [Myxococcales bacterium]
MFAGQNHTCVLLASGRVACWGWNDFGQLGDGSRTGRSRPAIVDGLMNVRDVALGAQHTCALRMDGTVLCFGDGRVDGLTGSDDGLAPVVLPSVTRLTEIEADGDGGHTCGLDDLGVVTCWGSDDSGQIGDGPTSTWDVPTDVLAMSDAEMLALGATHSCALRASQDVWCWGGNDLGTLGDGSGMQQDAPVMTVGLAQVAEIAAGAVHTCARRMFSDDIYCWGDNSVGQLGNGSTGVVTGLNRVEMLPRTTQLSLGGGHTCAVSGSGTVYCWGWNVQGQLGDGTLFDRTRPTEVPGLSGVVEVAAGGGHTCARTSANEVYCWGRNDVGQLGDGTTERRPAPVLVLAP